VIAIEMRGCSANAHASPSRRSVEELQSLREGRQAVSASSISACALDHRRARVVLSGTDAGAIYRYRRSERVFASGPDGFGDALAGDPRRAHREEETTAMARAVATVPVQSPISARREFPLRDLTTGRLRRADGAADRRRPRVGVSRSSARRSRSAGGEER